MSPITVCVFKSKEDRNTQKLAVRIKSNVDTEAEFDSTFDELAGKDAPYYGYFDEDGHPLDYQQACIMVGKQYPTKKRVRRNGKWWLE